MSTPYKKLQLRCKAAGLPANKSTAELTRLLAEHTTAPAPAAPNFDQAAEKDTSPAETRATPSCDAKDTSPAETTGTTPSPTGTVADTNASDKGKA